MTLKKITFSEELPIVSVIIIVISAHQFAAETLQWCRRLPFQAIEGKVFGMMLWLLILKVMLTSEGVVSGPK